MSGFIESEDRHQANMFPEQLVDYIAEDSAVRVIDVFIDDLNILGLVFKTEPNDTGRPAYRLTAMLKIYLIHGLFAPRVKRFTVLGLRRRTPTFLTFAVQNVRPELVVTAR